MRCSPNGGLTHEPGHGWVWTTECRGCGTRQRIRLGTVSLEQAAEAVSILNTTPMECPNGWHVELGGWRQYWSLDLMLEKYREVAPATPDAAPPDHENTPTRPDPEPLSV